MAPSTREAATARAEIVVPAPESPLARIIYRGSGCVATTTEAGVLVDYEGNRYGASNIRTYADRLAHAAGRQARRYPTSARALARPEDLVHVGWFDPVRGEATIDDLGALVGWIGERRAADPDELRTSDSRAATRRRIEAMMADPATRHQARSWARVVGIDL